MKETSTDNAKQRTSRGLKWGVVYNGSHRGDCLYSPRGQQRMSVHKESGTAISLVLGACDKHAFCMRVKAISF